MVTAIIGSDLYKTELITSTHTLLADEPAGSGGTDLGPAPEEFLLASLASCTAITLRMYAIRKKWLIEKIKVDVSRETWNGTNTFLCTIALEGTLSEVQRQRLLEIAGSCPIHKMLTSPIDIKTQLI